MQVPVKVSFKELPVDDDMEAACWREAEKLEQYCDRITSCDVTVSQPHRRHGKGNHYNVRIVLEVPHDVVVVNRDPPQHKPDEKPELAIREAFDSARRQLQDYVRRTRGKVKEHATPEHGQVASLAPDSGFIRTAEGDELYFHRNSLVHGSFDDLEVGTQVRFVSEQGDKGPQATSVRIEGRHHHLSS